MPHWGQLGYIRKKQSATVGYGKLSVNSHFFESNLEHLFVAETLLAYNLEDHVRCVIYHYVKLKYRLPIESQICMRSHGLDWVGRAQIRVGKTNKPIIAPVLLRR